MCFLTRGGTLSCFLTFILWRARVDELYEPRDSTLLMAFFVGTKFLTTHVIYVSE